MPLPKTITVRTSGDGCPIANSTVEQRGQPGLHEGRRHEQELAREAVGERAADRTEERDRHEPGGRDRPRPRGLVRVVFCT